MAYLKSPDLAPITFGQLDNSSYNAPYLSFQYMVQIELNRQALNDNNYNIADLNLPKINPLIKSVDMPSMRIETEKLNEYNRRRISQTRIDFDNVKVVMHDVVDGKCIRLWQIYYNYYFKDGFKAIHPNLETTANTGINPDDFSIGAKFGYNVGSVKNSRNFIEYIDIFQVHAGKCSKVRLVNPRIASFSHDTLTNESSDPVSLTFEFEYEYCYYETPVEIDDIRGMAQLFNKEPKLEHSLPSYIPGQQPYSLPVPKLKLNHGMPSHIPGQQPYTIPPPVPAELPADEWSLGGEISELGGAALDKASEIGSDIYDFGASAVNSGLSAISSVVDQIGGLTNAVQSAMEAPMALVELGQEVAGKVEFASTLAGSINSSKAGAFINVPQPNIRPFASKLDKVSNVYNDTTRVTSSIDDGLSDY